MLKNIKKMQEILFLVGEGLIMQNGVTDYSSQKMIDYIKYLEDKHNISISVHFTNKYSYMHNEKTMPGFQKYYWHVNAYCLYVKNVLHMQRKCWLCQALAARKCNQIESYEGSCHAGVHEYIRRFYCGNEVAGFISVSGYRDKKINYGQNAWYDDNMNSGPIPYELLEIVIPPLCAMMSEFLPTVQEMHRADSVYLQMLAYINEQHTAVTLDMLSKKFNYSKSYISHMFKRESGYTLKEYCNLLKIEDAKVLLEESNTSVTNIALSVGYNNFSYFINTFKRITGETPLAWRKRTRKDSEI